jgi:hypothetical protein
MTGRRGSESNGVFTDRQPQYPDLQGDFNTGFTGVQALFDTIRPLPDLTRHLPAACSVIEEIVEGFVEGFFWTSLKCCRFRPSHFPQKNSPLRGLSKG